MSMGSISSMEFSLVFEARFDRGFGLNLIFKVYCGHGLSRCLGYYLGVLSQQQIENEKEIETLIFQGPVVAEICRKQTTCCMLSFLYIKSAPLLNNKKIGSNVLAKLFCFNAQTHKVELFFYVWFSKKLRKQIIQSFMG